MPVVLMLPATVTVPDAEAIVTLPAVSVDAKVAPLALVIVTVERSVPMAPFTVTAPSVSKATAEVAPPTVPLMAPVVMAVLAPAPRIRLALLARTMEGREMAPVLVPPI